MTVAVVALVMALGGTGWAATQLAKNSVGTKQLKRNAVTAAKIKRDSITTRKIEDNAVTSAKIDNGTLTEEDFSVAALQTLTGLPGVKGDKGAKGDTGPPGDKGQKGDSALSPVPSGQTIHGAVGGDFHAFDATASDFGVDVTLPIPAANDLADGDVFVNIDGWQDAGSQSAPTTSDGNAGCTGTPAAPTAPAGKVCIYVSGSDHASNLAGDSVLFGTGASPYGFKLKWDASVAGDTFVDATWAYKAP
jgi:hypothetical protein